MNKPSNDKTAGDVPLYQLKITLEWSQPSIWRRVVVRSNMTLDRFHNVIQAVMPWTNSHLHQFILGRTYYGKPFHEFSGVGPEKLNEKKFTVAGLAPAAKKKFVYEYDFGDSWMHEVKVEKVLPPDSGFKHPVCLAGANACPPDDCGSLPGYYGMLEALADPKHPEHDHYKEWSCSGCFGSASASSMP